MLESAIPNVTMTLLSEEKWNEVKDSLQEIKNLIAQQNPSVDEWIPSQEARDMLGVSQKTWQTYRDNREISFSQRGRKIYVRRSDIDNFIQKHYIKSRDHSADDDDATQEMKNTTSHRKASANDRKTTTSKTTASGRQTRR